MLIISTDQRREHSKHKTKMASYIQEKFFNMVCEPNTGAEKIFTYYRTHRNDIDLGVQMGERNETIFHFLARNDDESILDGLLSELEPVEIIEIMRKEDKEGKVPMNTGNPRIIDVILSHMYPNKSH